MYRTGKTYWKLLQLIEISVNILFVPFFHLMFLCCCVVSRFVSLLSCTDLCFCFCSFFVFFRLFVCFSEWISYCNIFRVSYICLFVYICICICAREFRGVGGWDVWIGCSCCFLLFYFVYFYMYIYTHTRMSMGLQFMVKSYPFLYSNHTLR